jgi:hypothetical protein
VQGNFVRFLLTFRGSNRNILRSCIAHARYWARSSTNKGKFQQSSEKEAYQYGNEEEGHQKGSQEEKEVTEPGEASSLAIFLFNEKASAMWYRGGLFFV